MSTNQIKTYLIPVLLFLFSFLIRFFLISKGPYHIDCLNLAIVVEKTLESHSLQNLFGSGYPLTVLLGALFTWALRISSVKDPFFAINLMSVVFSSLCIPVFYAIGSKLFDKLTAFLASLILSLTPIFLGISVFGKSHTPSIFFLLAGIYFLLAFLGSHNKKHLLLSSIAIGLMGAARLQDMILMMIPISFLCLFGISKDPQKPSPPSAKREILGNILLFWGLAIGIVIIFHLPYLSNEYRLNYINNVFAFWHQGVPGNFKGLFSQSLIVSIIFLLITFTETGMILSIIGLLCIYKKSPRLLFFFLLWIGIPLFFYGNLYTTVPRFFALILPPLALAQGYMFAKLMKINFKFRMISTSVYCTTLYLIFAFIFPLLYVRHTRALLPEYTQWVEKTIEKDAYLIASDDALFYSYFSTVNILYRPAHFRSLEEPGLDAFKQRLDALLNDNIPVYITSVGLYAYDPEMKFSSLIENNYTLKIVGKNIYEDWHRGVLKQKILDNYLIRIKKN